MFCKTQVNNYKLNEGASLPIIIHIYSYNKSSHTVCKTQVNNYKLNEGASLPIIIHIYIYNKPNW